MSDAQFNLAIGKIEPLSFSAAPEAQSAISSTGTEVNFWSLLNSGLSKVDESIQAAGDLSIRAALGESIPTHQIMLAVEDARFKLQLAVQVRNKLIDAYQELTRISI
jgi:flagellar hook-basal body complex protein FliE